MHFSFHYHLKWSNVLINNILSCLAIHSSSFFLDLTEKNSAFDDESFNGEDCLQARENRRWCFRTPRCNQIPIKATPFVAWNGIVVTLLSATRTHYNSLCCSRSVDHSKMPNATPGRCNVAAIFYYKDNLIHIVNEIP